MKRYGLTLINSIFLCISGLNRKSKDYPMDHTLLLGLSIVQVKVISSNESIQESILNDFL